jgi:hypothetical protein
VTWAPALLETAELIVVWMSALVVTPAGALSVRL